MILTTRTGLDATWDLSLHLTVEQGLLQHKDRIGSKSGGRRGQLLPACAKAVLSTVVATVLGSMEITGRAFASVALALTLVLVTQKVARHSFADWRAATAAGLVLVTVVRFPSYSTVVFLACCFF